MANLPKSSEGGDSHFCPEGNFEEEDQGNPEPKRTCFILYSGKGLRPSPCNGEIRKVEKFIRSEMRLGGPKESPFDTYGVCEKCKVRTDW